jgi:sulfur relay (sulfurtransferase) complex TusBCD TusD component (DsrE family)
MALELVHAEEAAGEVPEAPQLGGVRQSKEVPRAHCAGCATRRGPTTEPADHLGR